MKRAVAFAYDPRFGDHDCQSCLADPDGRAAFRNCPLHEVADRNADYRFRYRRLDAEDAACPRGNYLEQSPLLWLAADCEAYGQLPTRAAGILEQPQRLMDALRLIRSESRRHEQVSEEKNEMMGHRSTEMS